MNKRIISATLIAIFTVLIFLPLQVLANEANVSSVEAIQQNAINQTLDGDNSSRERVTMSDIDGSNMIPNTTIEDANQWVARKGDDLVGFGGTIAEPLAIIGFMLGLFLTLIGGFSKSKILTKGLLVMAISIIVYVGAVFAPEIVHYFSGWLSS